MPVSGWLDSVDTVDTSLVACNGGGCGYEWCDTMPRCGLLSRVSRVSCHVCHVSRVCDVCVTCDVCHV